MNVLSGSFPVFANAFIIPFIVPKSPQPGHHVGCLSDLKLVNLMSVLIFLLAASDRTPVFMLRADARWCRSLRNLVWYHAFEFVTVAISMSVIPCASISALTAGGSVSSVSSTCGLTDIPSTLIATSLPRRPCAATSNSNGRSHSSTLWTQTFASPFALSQ